MVTVMRKCHASKLVFIMPGFFMCLGENKRYVRYGITFFYACGPRTQNRFRITFTAKVGTTEMPHGYICPALALAVFSFSLKLSSFAFTSETKNILRYFHLCAYFFFKKA